MFQFSGFPSLHYVFMQRYTGITLYEFPHSEIFGSKVACTSPKLIAAYHVLHRLLVPRHSPYALNNLTFYKSTFTSILFVELRAQSVTYIKYVPFFVCSLALTILQILVSNFFGFRLFLDLRPFLTFVIYLRQLPVINAF